MFKIKNLFYILLLIILSIKNSYSIENKILFKIDNEIISSIDILNETRYLKATNKNFQKIQKEDIYKISLNSIIREKIKKIELQKNLEELVLEKEYLEQLIISTFKRLDFQKKQDFVNHLHANQINLKMIEEKVTIEALWNELIYFKFFEKVVIDEKKLKKSIEQQKQKKIRSFFLSEIVFNKKENLSIDQTFEQINRDIANGGFENAALIYSISNSANKGGEIGWINEDTMNKKFKKELVGLKIGEYTKPITIPGGFLILKLKDIKEIENEIDIEKKLKELIKSETNQQLNQYSNIYYNKVKRNIQINEL